MSTALTKIHCKTWRKREQLWRGRQEIQVGDYRISYIGRLPVRLGKAQYIMANNEKTTG